MPNFTQSPEDQAFERMMRHKPNFEPDAPEVLFIQQILDQDKRRKEIKNMIYRGRLHKEIFERELNIHPMTNNRYCSALYLLTADIGLWNQVEDHVTAHDIDIAAMHPTGLSGSAYVFFTAAKDILTGSRNVSVTDLADSNIISPQNFLVVTTALAIRGFGLNAAKRMAAQPA